MSTEIPHPTAAELAELDKYVSALLEDSGPDCPARQVLTGVVLRSLGLISFATESGELSREFVDYPWWLLLSVVSVWRQYTAAAPEPPEPVARLLREWPGRPVPPPFPPR